MQIPEDTLRNKMLQVATICNNFLYIQYLFNVLEFLQEQEMRFRRLYTLYTKTSTRKVFSPASLNTIPANLTNIVTKNWKSHIFMYKSLGKVVIVELKSIEKSYCTKLIYN